MTGFSGFLGRGPNSRFPFPSRREPFSRQEILQKMDGLEHRVNQYLDAAIGFETRRNATDVQVLQEIRSTDVPQFFNNLRQKLNATVPVTGTTVGGGAIVAPITGVNGTGQHFTTGYPGFLGRGPSFGLFGVNPRFQLPFPFRRDPYSRQEILHKMNRLEQWVNRYLDAAIGFETRRNATDVQVLQEIRSTDVPQFFNSLRQKLNTTVPGTGTTIEGGVTGSVAFGA
ncbi:unnamed protein product [Oppiella nova]|uniref:Uncharacterized protein n=1 Tax=Oppiella nova TaxID=334625 RepID=A0A7R9QR38_9ACAR|nr:unnamed protein product [Oppiella nova]CAG2170734.1 unnamed protein product [Oppiella nova]